MVNTDEHEDKRVRVEEDSDDEERFMIEMDDGTKLTKDDDGTFVVENGERRATLAMGKVNASRWTVSEDDICFVKATNYVTDEATMFVDDMKACAFIGNVFEARDGAHTLQVSSRTSVAYLAHGGVRVNLIDGMWITSPVSYAACDSPFFTAIGSMNLGDVEVWKDDAPFHLKGHTGTITGIGNVGDFPWEDDGSMVIKNDAVTAPLIVTTSLDGTVRFWSTGFEVALIDVGVPITCFLLAHRAGKTYVVVHSRDAERVVWFDAETRAEVARFDGVQFHGIAHGATTKMVPSGNGYSSVDLGIPPFIEGVDAEGEAVARVEMGA